ncbi:MAG: flagellar biosynthetic protein FliO [Clostridiaceae bacterium]|nr:flagellar biosynthetic protein FliO [Clostridiaceae bacterium]
MLVILSGFSTLASIIKLIALLLVFIAILVGAHLFTKWYAKSGHVNAKARNIKVIESQQIAPGKNIVLAQIGGKYVAFISGKEHSTFLTELDESDIDLTTPEVNDVSFRDVLKNMKELNKKKEE